MAEEKDRLTMTVCAAAEAIGVNRNSLYAAIRKGEFKDLVLKVGNRILISRAALAKRLSGVCQ